MTCLLYCVVDSRTDYGIGAISGVGGRPLSVVATGGLGAVLSDSTDLDLTPDKANVLAYHRVITSIHQNGTVIPLRYGQVVKRASAQALELLAEQGERFATLLRELEGCVEMGIRVIVPNVASRSVSVSPARPDLSQSLSAGHAFLAARRIQYSQLEQTANVHRAIIEQCRAAFAGTFIKCNMESPTIPNSMLALYFLVLQDSLNAFRGAFHRMKLTDGAKLLISGPWPPYNFV
ncbi:MAG: GvpL/GvpF family gas vesicle protein [Calditrichota bacterium]